MKTLIIIVLIIIILGLYFAPEITKSIMKKTGQATANVVKDAAQKVSDSESVEEAKEKVKGAITDRLNKTSN